MSVAIYFIHNHQEWKQPKYAPSGEWRNTLCFIHAMQYYSTTKKEKTIGTHNNLDTSQRHHAEKKKPISKVFMNLFKWGSREGKTVGIRKQISRRQRLELGVGMTTEKHEGNYWGEGTFLHLGYGYETISLCQNS